jgi:hypothetical protein
MNSKESLTRQEDIDKSQISSNSVCPKIQPPQTILPKDRLIPDHFFGMICSGSGDKPIPRTHSDTNTKPDVGKNIGDQQQKEVTFSMSLKCFVIVTYILVSLLTVALILTNIIAIVHFFSSPGNEVSQLSEFLTYLNFKMPGFIPVSPRGEF